MSSNKNKKYQIIAWLICSLGAVYYAYEYFLRIAPSVMEPQLRNHFNLSASGFGFLSAFYYYAYVPMQLPVGVLMDRYGPRRLLTLACLLCVIGTFLFAGTTLFAVAASGRFLVGLGSSFAFVGVLKLATIWLPEDKLAMVAGMAAALGTIGAMVGDNILGSMVFNLGWQPTVYITGFFGIGLAVLLWFGIKDNKRKTRKSGTIDSFKKNMVDLGIIAKNGQIWINGFYGCLVYLPTTVFAELWGIPYLRHAYGMTESGAHFANSLLFLGFTIGAPLMGFISDKLHRRKPPMIVGATGAAFIMMFILYMPGLNHYTLYALMLMLGILYSAQAIVFAVGRELSPKEAAGTAIAMTNMIVMIGAMFLQPLVGALLDWSSHMHVISVPVEVLPLDKMSQFYTADDYQFAMSIIPLGILIAAILTLFLRETYASADRSNRQ
ncbi:MFS transporter [Legionella impletisoli]|uniref:Lysosomal dipeptide transporter MFSD1 n=1 Tax=Legionella impletisoli TaxID=343510 RepID=A0A917JY57_9GAMM|nr:MFS transporter [Legionella impletisoli]GGI91899.1 MFS transporter [Legionella impletisoli]